MPKTVPPCPRLWTILFLILVTGCSSSAERLVELGQQSADRQAEQNQTIADQSQQVTETTHQFVESSGDARKEMIELQRELVEAEASARNELVRIQQDLVDRDAQCRQELNSLQRESQAAGQTERLSIDRQREGLESERRQISGERQRAPIIAAAVSQVGLVLACLLPLVLCGYLLYVLRHNDDNDAAVTELLIQEIVADQPRFLSVPGPAPAIDEEPRVPSIEDASDSEGDEQLASPAPVA
jgi:hypothetical protein